MFGWWTRNAYLLLLLCEAFFMGSWKTEGWLVCSLETEVGKGLPVSLIGHHLLVDQVHLESFCLQLEFQTILQPMLAILDQRNKAPTCWRVFGVRTFSPLKSMFSYLQPLIWFRISLTRVRVLYLVFFEKWSFFQALLLLNSEVEGIQSSSVAYLHTPW